MGPLRLAVVGCGKVSERFHLPVARAHDGFDVRVVVDADLARARSMADRFAVPTVLDRVDDLPELVDAVIVATPHHTHAGLAIGLLQRGVHVLVEKPMALSTVECDAMTAAAREAGTVLAVGLVRRFYDSARFVKDLIDDGALGPIVGFDAQEGAVFGWQVVSDATFRRDAGGGVLSDIGVHVFDLLAWWLGDLTVTASADDAQGGVDAEAVVGLRTPGGSLGTVEMSRTRTLRNTIRVRGERAAVEVGPGFDSPVRLAFAGRERFLMGSVGRDGAPRPSSLEDVFMVQLDDFAAAIAGKRPPLVPGSEGRRAIALIEACRELRQPLEFPWLRPWTTSATDAPGSPS